MKRIILFTLLAIICTVFAKNCRQVCTPNETFMIACNKCHCSPDGTSYGCTKIFCPSEPPHKCIPGLPVKMDCNTCTCNSDGTIGACTLMACPPIKD